WRGSAPGRKRPALRRRAARRETFPSAPALARGAQDILDEDDEKAGEKDRRAEGVAEEALAEEIRDDADPGEDGDREVHVLDEEPGELAAGGGEPFHLAVSVAPREIQPTAAAAVARKSAAMPRIARSSPGQ